MAIKNYLKGQAEDDQYIDFVCVGNRGLNVGNAVDGENYLGTVAQNMIAMRKLNVIFVPWIPRWKDSCRKRQQQTAGVFTEEETRNNKQMLRDK